METIGAVVNDGRCSGCGACSVASLGSLKMTRQNNGTYLPVQIKSNVPTEAQSVCPFTLKQDRPPRIQIGHGKAGAGSQTENLIGAFNSLGVGRISANEVWESSSGGLTTWLLLALLKLKLIDGVVHLGSGNDSSPGELFSYKISTSETQVLRNRGTKYYASTIERAFKDLEALPGRFAFVGVPCFVNAVDNLRLQSSEWSEKIRYTIGLVCGHLKSQLYSEALAWQLGIEPSKLSSVDFRVKKRTGSPLDYQFGARSSSGDWVTKDSAKLLGANWGHSAFSLSACNSCTDLFAYTSDVTFGDAWLPEYQREPRGTNIVVIRNSEFLEIFNSGLSKGEIEWDLIKPEKVLESQSGGIAHRIVGYVIRNRGSKNSDPQQDFNLTIQIPTLRRKTLIIFRKVFSLWTLSGQRMQTRSDFKLWKLKFQLFRYTYKSLEIFSKLGQAKKKN